MKKLEELVKEQFPVLRKQGMPQLVLVSDEALGRAFPDYDFLAAIVRRYPVARAVPQPLTANNVFAVKKNEQVQHLKDAKSLEEFFRDKLAPVTDARTVKDGAAAWVRLTEEFKQDGFFKFSIARDSLAADRATGRWEGSGKTVVTQGGKGEIAVKLIFTESGKLKKVDETSTLKAGIRPICQATKLLDADTIVRRMAEKDILVMGRAAKDYLDDERAKASPQLKNAIDRVWERIMKEGW